MANQLHAAVVQGEVGKVDRHYVQTPHGLAVIEEKTTVQVQMVAIVGENSRQPVIPQTPASTTPRLQQRREQPQIITRTTTPTVNSAPPTRAQAQSKPSSSSSKCEIPPLVTNILILAVAIGVGVGVGYGIAKAVARCSITTTSFTDYTNPSLSSTTEPANATPQSTTFANNQATAQPALAMTCVEVCGQIASGSVLNKPVGFATQGAPLLSFKAAFCDCSSPGGPWTVFQRRIHGSVDFYRNWQEYSNGFGNSETDFWMGLDDLYQFTNDGTIHQLRIDLEDWEGNRTYATYSTFSISDSLYYTLQIDGYSGNAGNSLSFHNNRRFTTRDRDNSGTSHCSVAVIFDGGWWFEYNSYLERAYLNGQYLETKSGDYPIYGIFWSGFRGEHYSLKSVEMKFK